MKRYYYPSHDHLKRHLHTFLMAYTFAKRLKTLTDTLRTHLQNLDERTRPL